MHIDSKARPLPNRRRARTRQARPSRNARNTAEPGRDKRVPPGTPGTPQNPDATSASLPERPERRRTRTRQARPSRNVAEPGRDKRVPPGSPQCSKESPFSGGMGLSRPQSPTRHFDGHGSLRRLLHMPHGMAHSPARPRGNKGARLSPRPSCALPGVFFHVLFYVPDPRLT